MANTEGMQTKYLVLKWADVKEHLNSLDAEDFMGLVKQIEASKEFDGDPANGYLVINTDEPYVDQVIDILKANGHWGEGDLAKQQLSITTMVKAAHANAVAKGWWDEDRSFGECIALIHSEASEALEDFRVGKHPNESWYTAKGDTVSYERDEHDELPPTIIEEDDGTAFTFNQISEFWKPCGVPSELADIVIRVADLAGRYDIDLERAIKEKMAYNATRAQRHNVTAVRYYEGS